MIFSAQVIRVLIASPSDVEAEREIAVRTIQEWNDINSPERKIVLLPVRWETHSAPAMGRPQEILNTQLVDHCDMAVGVFWTRLGSPTGMADSGTIEEIERMAESQKRVMLYFSRAKQDPDSIDPDQLKKLKEFRKSIQEKALIQSYSNAIEFHDLLYKQLELSVREITTSLAPGGEGAKPYADIDLSFADPVSGSPLGNEKEIKSALITVSDFDNIVDYVMPAPSSGGTVADLLSARENRDYYRQVITRVVAKGVFRPIRFSLSNQGGVGARDVFIEVEIESASDALLFEKGELIPDQEPSPSSTWVGGGFAHPRDPALFIRPSKIWHFSFSISAIQPQRCLAATEVFLVGATESCEATLRAKIYADCLPTPIIKELPMSFVVEQKSVKASVMIPLLEKFGIVGTPSSVAEEQRPLKRSTEKKQAEKRSQS